MITFVNTVLVGTGKGTIVNSMAATKSEDAIGKYIVVDGQGAVIANADAAAKAEAIKVGLINNKSVKWSHIIKKDAIKSYHFTGFETETEDVVTFDFSPIMPTYNREDINMLRVVVRLTFKDMDTRYRKWSESYEILVDANLEAEAIKNQVSLEKMIVSKFVDAINGDEKHPATTKRARVNASILEEGDSTKTYKLKIEAKTYDDDNAIDTISPANKVRFNGNAWYTVPEADGFESKNKYNAAKIDKVPGKWSIGSWKLVRDAEAQAMGYEGILNRGEGTWPIIKPAMNVVMNAKYDSITLEFENRYRAADDIMRYTRNTLQVFDIENKLTTGNTGLKGILEAFVSGKASGAIADGIKANTSDIID